MTSSKLTASMLPKPGPTMVVETFNLVLQSVNTWVQVINREKTHRKEIRAWEETQVSLIKVQRDFLMKGLDLTFDERRENFRRLFENLDSAMRSDREDAGALVSEILGAITELAKTSPFKELTSPTIVVQEFLRNGKVIEL